ncbi:hypothetical protein ACFRMQ_22060, partial [Kitasatospora sp. NPDC056783]|uniref:hypothetical protein n=1 Tax=Kitasatospora sp. NPDC056783 TaxID=3345943 RepID=UPI00369F1977
SAEGSPSASATPSVSPGPHAGGKHVSSPLGAGRFGHHKPPLSHGVLLFFILLFIPATAAAAIAWRRYKPSR